MRKLTILLAVVGLLAGCDTGEKEWREIQERQEYKVVLIYDCEYIQYATGLMYGTSYYGHTYNAKFLIHKGNCKNPIHYQK